MFRRVRQLLNVERRTALGLMALGLLLAGSAGLAARSSLEGVPAPAQIATRSDGARALRLQAARSWGYQLAGLDLAAAERSPFDLLVVDPTTGLVDERPMAAADVRRLRRKADGAPRVVLGYLSVGEAEDYRADYFTAEYLEEDAPDWLMHENPRWKGNRIIRFCAEGWQQTILGDAQGRSVYNSIEASPLYRMIELGLDGVYLDRVDVYQEVGKDCPDAEARMVDFVVRLAAHARRKNPQFMVVLQNAEELLRHPRLLAAIDAAAKEDLFYGVDHSQSAQSPGTVKASLEHLHRARKAGRAVFVVEYLKDPARRAEARKRIEAEGFVPYLAPRGLDALWLPGKDF
jgi:cysteinyl-tRNA synthetase